MIVTCSKCRARFRLGDHEVKPEGATVRCSQCSHVFRVFPEPAPAGEKQAPGLEDLTREFQAALDKVLASAGVLLDELEEEAGPPPAEGAENNGSAAEILEKLETLLKQNDFEAEDYFRAVKGQLADHGLSEQADHLEKLIKSFEFKAALTVLAQLGGAADRS